MNVAGIDVSTHAIDLVLLDMDSDKETWHRYELRGADLIDRIRSIREVAWGGTFDETVALGIERPSGQHKGAMAAVSMAFGAVLVRLPAWLLVQPWQPAEWRKACGLSGRATKEDVAGWALARWGEGKPSAIDVTFDACDAYCIAYATRQRLLRRTPRE